MAFHDILRALDAEADGRIAAARAAARASMDEARTRSESATADAITSIERSCERERADMERQAAARSHMLERQAVLKAKHEAMEKTYARALEQLANLDEKTTESLLRSLLDACPEGGVLRPTEAHAGILKKLAAGREIGATVHGSGGFVHESTSSERDCRYEILVRDILRPATEVRVAETLFPSNA